MDTECRNINEIDPEAFPPMYAMDKYIRSGALGEDLLTLVDVRTSRINGCTHCVDSPFGPTGNLVQQPVTWHGLFPPCPSESTMS